MAFSDGWRIDELENGEFVKSLHWPIPAEDKALLLRKARTAPAPPAFRSMRIYRDATGTAINIVSSNHQQIAALDETWANTSPSPLWGEGLGGVLFDQRLFRQGMADFETLRQVTEQGRTFLGEHAGQPMAHELQNELTVLKSGTWRSFTCPEGMFGKHVLGAAGEFVC